MLIISLFHDMKINFSSKFTHQSPIFLSVTHFDKSSNILYFIMRLGLIEKVGLHYFILGHQNLVFLCVAGGPKIGHFMTGRRVGGRGVIIIHFQINMKQYLGIYIEIPSNFTSYLNIFSESHSPIHYFTDILFLIFAYTIFHHHFC